VIHRGSGRLSNPEPRGRSIYNGPYISRQEPMCLLSFTTRIPTGELHTNSLAIGTGGFQTTPMPYSWMCDSRALCANAYLRRLEEHRREGRINQVRIKESRVVSLVTGPAAASRQGLARAFCVAEPATRPLILCSSSCKGRDSSHACWASLVSASRILAL